jgi:hypothetical protein
MPAARRLIEDIRAWSRQQNAQPAQPNDTCQMTVTRYLISCKLKH